MICKHLPLHDKAILGLVKSLLLPYARITQPHVKLDLKTLRKRLRGCMTFVFIRGGRKVCGFIAIRQDKNVMYVDMLAVDRTNQGLGIGSTLLKHAERYGQLKGHKEIFLWVDDTNIQAQRFYTAKGYESIHYDAGIRCYMLRKFLNVIQTQERQWSMG
ncbi:Acetyltransferase (GNAT) family protein [Paenibacillus sp. 1_12]|uniref:GNAT family N-acetyltransferase n=1 Tax=Paenibacillus sp. 1_12 TaxID=1566278 RepID=UPI0008F06A0D|nr:GNAT family N-acetyltransferase [Paenibacillus sp. 1_12]SFM15317.1 Acetyltransferase (GNAT) family protein [Paenibacillus sp. 1_12]